jgi:hypothetical protein
MYIINELWYVIKKYLIHNIKIQGKHLKEHKEIEVKNKCLKDLIKVFKKTASYLNYYIWDKPDKYKLVLYNLKKQTKGLLFNWNYLYWDYSY